MSHRRLKGEDPFLGTDLAHVQARDRCARRRRPCFSPPEVPMSLALPVFENEGPPAEDYEGRPICCDTCPARASGSSCQPRHACVQDRYALRVDRFFRWNPRGTEAWLTHPYFEVRAIAARFANVFRVAALVSDPDETVRTSVALRVPHTILRRMIDDPEREVRIRVAQRLPPPALVAMVRDEDYYVRVWVARRLPLPLLMRMAEDPEREVRLEVARRLDPARLALLASDPEAAVRRVVAERGPSTILGVLARDSDWAVRWEVAQRASVHLAQLLARDPEEEVSSAARARLKELGTD
ncbi:MAG TPA: 4Fe4S-binding leucine-rich repeat protein [Polyangiaceae bacterium]|nr:4Fe4S-binding leucine-rich repeat protein [Polyangiaceae bacterium]